MTVEIVVGDVRDALATMPDKSVHCVVTSPPYFGLRSYGTPPQVWGGDAGCAHEWGEEIPGSNRGGSGPGKKQASAEGYGRAEPRGGFCVACGAWLGHLGLEPTLALFIEHLVGVFREVKRVLRDDGTLFLNIGDSYCSHDPGGRRDGEFLNPGGRQSEASKGARNKAGTFARGQFGLKAKDLMMVPARLAIALQDDGWYLRSDIIWHKRAPMPESVTDRPTSAHEHIFLLSKQPRYYYDADAVREAHETAERQGERRSYKPGSASSMNDGDHQSMAGSFAGLPLNPAGRNQRNVWTLSPESFPDAHFATFPTEIPRRAIKAGCPVDGTVLDPFSGSGTTGMVAAQLGRNYVGVELNPVYAEMSRKRIVGDAPMFNVVTVREVQTR